MPLPVAATKVTSSLMLAAVLLAATTVPAAAQSTPGVILNNTSFSRREPLRPPGQMPRWINKADCLADDVLTFRTAVMAVDTTMALEVWAGTGTTDCREPQSRGVVTDACWLVYRQTPTSGIRSVDVRAQDIVGRMYPARSGALDEHGVPRATVAACDAGASLGGPVQLYFMLLQENSVVGATGVWRQTVVDIDPPAPVTDLAVEPGDGSLLLSWTATAPADLLEWRFYCDGPGDGSAGADSCPEANSALVPGQSPSEEHRCGTATDPSARSGDAQGLTYDLTYAVGMAGVDTVGNVGELSELACGTPEPHTEAGRPVGSRGCSTSRGAGAVSTVEAGAVLVAGLTLARRRRPIPTSASRNGARGGWNRATHRG